MEKMTKKQAIEMVNNSFPTIFAKEDVLKLIESINVEETKTNEVIIKALESVKKEVKGVISDMSSDEIVDFDSIELSIGYGGREICIDSISVDSDQIISSIDSCIDDIISGYETEEEENEGTNN